MADKDQSLAGSSCGFLQSAPWFVQSVALSSQPVKSVDHLENAVYLSEQNTEPSIKM